SRTRPYALATASTLSQRTTPPARPRPPARDCTLSMTGMPISRAAATASSAVPTVRPAGTAIPYSANSAFARCSGSSTAGSASNEARGTLLLECLERLAAVGGVHARMVRLGLEGEAAGEIVACGEVERALGLLHGDRGVLRDRRGQLVGLGPQS